MEACSTLLGRAMALVQSTRGHEETVLEAQGLQRGETRIKGQGEEALMKDQEPNVLEDLQVVPFIGPKGRRQYLVTQRSGGMVCQLGEEELFLLTAFRKGMAEQEIASAFQVRFHKTVNHQDLKSFFMHLSSLGLMANEKSQCISAGRTHGSIRLFKGESFIFNRIMDAFAFILSPPVMVLGVFLTVAGLGVMVKDYELFVRELKVLWRPAPFFLKTILGLFFVHFCAECAKSAAARSRSIAVDGLSFHWLYRIIPRFVCELSPDYWFASKKHRLYIFASGIYVQWLLGMLAILAWKNTSHDTGLHDFSILLVFASTFFGFLNTMPFLYRDGYFILGLWLSEENLHERSRAHLRAWCGRRAFPEALPTARRARMLAYGLLSYVYEGGVWLVLCGILGYLMIFRWGLKGVGCVLLLAVVILRLEASLRRMGAALMTMGFVNSMWRDQGGSVHRKKLIHAGAVLAFVLVSFWPYTYETSGRFMVVPEWEYSVRARVPGQVIEVLVQPNQEVKVDQPLVVLDDRGPRLEVEKLQWSLARQEAELELLRQGPKPEEVALARQDMERALEDYHFWRAEAERAKGLVRDGAMSDKDYSDVLHARDVAFQTYLVSTKRYELVRSGPRPEELRAREAAVKETAAQLEQARNHLKDTVIRSPAHGRFVGNPFPCSGQFLNVGDLVGVVLREGTGLVEIFVPQYDGDKVSESSSVYARAWAHPTRVFSGRIEYVDSVVHDASKARLERTLTEREIRMAPTTLGDEQPVIKVLCRMQDDKGMLKPGMTGYAKIALSRQPVLLAFSRWLVRFLMVEVWSWIP